MSFIPITDDEIQVGKPVFGPTGFGQKVKDNFDFLFGQIATLESGQVLNGSFELEDEASPGLPSNWDTATYPGGTIARVDSESEHGEWSLKCTHPGGAGNGGGNATSDYIECSPLWANRLSAMYRATVASGLKVQIKVQYFTAAKVSISTETLLDNSTTNPTTAELFGFLLDVPATARFMKVILIGGLNDTNPGSVQSVYFDSVRLSPEIVYSPGIYIAAASDTQAISVNSTPTTVKQILAGRSGRIRVSFNLYRETTAAGSYITADVYVDGVLVFSKQNDSSTPVLFEEDVPVKAGDNVSLKLYGGVPANEGYVDNYRLKINNPSEAYVIQ